MAYWKTARKGSTGIHVSYGHTFSNNLYAENSRVWSEGPDIEIRLDLNGNLRSRTKQDNMYMDARELADGEIDRLELLQIDHDRLLDTLRRALKGFAGEPQTWYLTVELKGDHRFEVEPELRREGQWQSLFLHVKQPMAVT